MSIDLNPAIKHIYPDVSESEYTIGDNGDGPVITYWGYQGGNEPTQEELNIALDEIGADIGKPNLIGEVKIKMDSVIKGSVSHGDVLYNSDLDTAIEIESTIICMSRDNLSSAMIRNKSGDFVTLNATQLGEIGCLITGLRQSCYANAKSLIDSISAAQNQNDLDAIDIESGWPTVPYTDS